MRIEVIGGGLAGCEAAWQLAERGVDVELVEMRPTATTAAHATGALAELVCSNSFKSRDPENAHGLLKEELARAGSLILRAAAETSVPAGAALAVDRARFAAAVTAAVTAHQRIRVARREVTELPALPCIVATGPLTGSALAADIARVTGAGELYFYDSIAPIVDAESIDPSIVFAASRYDKGGDDYLNCPLDEAEYRTFVSALLAGDKVASQDFEEAKYFEGCLPIEVMAARGFDALAFGPMKPVGLRDPRTGRRPHAVVQLRAENRARTAFNMVGFQTKLKWPEQARIFRMIPGLARTEFLRFGSVHRNTFVNAPKVLDAELRLWSRPNVRLAGQVTGVEGYIESTAMGFVAAVALAAERAGRSFSAPPPTTAIGALARYVTEGPLHGDFQPMNVNWGLIPPLADNFASNLRESQRLFPAQSVDDPVGRSRGGNGEGDRTGARSPHRERASEMDRTKETSVADAKGESCLIELGVAAVPRSPTDTEGEPHINVPKRDRRAATLARARRDLADWLAATTGFAKTL